MTASRTARTPIASQFWLLAIAAFVVRLVAAVVTDGLRHPELNEYDSIARTLVSSGQFLYWHIGVPYFSYAPPLDAWVAAAFTLACPMFYTSETESLHHG